jgi:ATP-dependent Clp protease adaptor protein ClpS
MAEKHEFEDVVESRSRERLEEPPLYKVLLHNDNYTTMDFVVYVLMTVFNKGEAEAFRIMLQVHHAGTGVAGVYPFEIAETKAAKVVELARDQEFPLMCSVQEA